MEQTQTYLAADPNRTRLLEAAQTMVLQGDREFSIAELCGAAGLERSVFHDHFAGKTALMAALMRDYPVGGSKSVQQALAAAANVEPVSKADTTPEPSVSTPDEWFERRLRVFERALTALEAKSDATAREQAGTIAQLQEQLKNAASPMAAVEPLGPIAPAIEVQSLEPQIQDEAPVEIEPVVMQARETNSAAPVVEANQSADDSSDLPLFAQFALQTKAAQEAKPESPATMAEALPFTRNTADLEANEPPRPPKASPRMRLMALAAAFLVAVFICVGFLLGRNLMGANAEERAPDGVSHRVVAKTPIHKTMALADAGDARAQARLALAYLRGQGSAADANAALLWCMSAAKAGNPVAQYLLGALYQQGDHVTADPAQAAAWFARGAEKGNLKAMHNLAIAYAQGQGVAKDESKAAEWFTRAAERGYVDSAFDLAVLYERGEGVTQDLKQALKWYGIASLAGDVPSKARADFLRSQMKPLDIKLATNAAMAFAPLPALEDANSL